MATSLNECLEALYRPKGIIIVVYSIGKLFEFNIAVDSQ
jgi:hypothetical protein